ncbi:MAG: hypothetical protein FK733_04125, partial [Asgard group archaeon]|nr:hypothetical protein [Asgard group archaeon]
MEEIIFCFETDGKVLSTFILVESIRRFSGKFANAPIWAFTKVREDDFPIDALQRLQKLNIQLHYLDIEKEVNDKFPFISVVKATATAEKLALGKTKLLMWLAENSIFLDEPNDLILNENKNLGYRPVHHILIGSLYDKPLDDFWEMLYEKCEVPSGKVFPMKTHVDNNIIRPYFNSGFLIVKPERELFQKYWENYKKLHNDLDITKYYEKDDKYVTFIHQVVLSCTILANLDLDEIQELPSNYNYPLHLHDETPENCQPKKNNELKTARFYLDKLFSKGINDLPLTEKQMEFLRDKLQ